MRQLRSFPNLLTLLRLLFIPFIVIAVLDSSYQMALAVFLLAGFTDALDGLLARALKQKTIVGQYLDPIADKLLLSTMFLVLSFMHLVRWKVTVLVFSRDLLIVVVAAVLYGTGQMREFRPSLLGKANTLAQILTVLLVMLGQSTGWYWTEQARPLAIGAVVGFTLASGVHYVIRVVQPQRMPAGAAFVAPTRPPSGAPAHLEQEELPPVPGR